MLNVSTKKIVALPLILSVLFSVSMGFAQSTQKNADDTSLLNQFVESKGYTASIVFSDSNVKQFWIDKSVFSKDGNIYISLKKNGQAFESVPLKVQLANVNEAQDCTIDIISETPGLSLSVENNKSKNCSVSTSNDTFIHYQISSAIFHLEATQDFSFFLKIKANTDLLTIKKIIFSFSNNKESSYLASPGTIKIMNDTVSVDSSNTSLEKINDSSFSATGVNTLLTLKKKILVFNNTFTLSSTIKNTGNTQTRIYLGYTLFTKDGKRIRSRNYPYDSNDKVLTVTSSETGSNRIVVDSYANWKKNCYLALNAKEDFSDCPNLTLAESKIVSIEKKDDGTACILLENPLKEEIPAGTKVRVHSFSSTPNVYMHDILLDPGKEVTLSSSIKKDKSSLVYSTKAFCMGAYYVQPVILSYSTDKKSNNTVVISNFQVSY